MIRRLIALSLLVLGSSSLARAETICTTLRDAASGEVLVREGSCEGRVSPASTFKIPIALMGFDAGLLRDAHHPIWPFKPGYASWREEWKRDTDPSWWMKESVVWYSQEITRKLGMAKFKAYVDGFDYGNEDVSGTRGKDDGLTEAWLSTSLAISPLEQTAFLSRMVTGKLPVSAQAVEKTAQITLVGDTPNGWTLHGKTGMGFALDAAGKPVRDKPYGWFVGWASKGGRTITFARLDRDASRQDTPTSYRARDGIIAELPARLEKLAP